MTIGKREQVVIGVVTVIVIVAALHFLIFSPESGNLAAARANHDAAVAQVNQLQRPPSPMALQDFTSRTEFFRGKLVEGYDQIGLTSDTAFLMPKKDDPDFLNKLIAKLTTQVNMCMDEISRLATFQDNQQTRMTFLNQQNWAIPTQLPQRVQPPALWDLLASIQNTQGLLTASGSGPLKDQMQTRYNQLLLQLGIDPAKAQQLDLYGQFVPTIYELQTVNLIMNQVPQGQKLQVGGQTLDTVGLMKLLGIDPPTKDVGGQDENQLPDNQYTSYFLYQQLHNLNEMLAMAPQHQIAEISEVRFWPFAYLRKSSMEKRPPEMAFTAPADLTDDRRMPYTFQADAKISDTANAPAGGGSSSSASSGGSLASISPEDLASLHAAGLTDEVLSGMSPMEINSIIQRMHGFSVQPGIGTTGYATPAPEGATQTKDVTPTEDDIGYAIPIEITFTATNRAGWAYVYDVLTKSPLTQLYRIQLQSVASMTNRANTDAIQFKVMFLFVPKLFKTMEAVEQMLNATGGAAAPATPPAG